MNLITDNQTESFIAIPDVLAGSRSSFLQDGGGTGNGISPEILEQVENGVAIRMAVIYLLAKKNFDR